MLKELLFNELNIIVIDEKNNEKTSCDDKSIVKSITLNENIKTLGYSLTPCDIVRMSKQEDEYINNVFENISSYLPEIKTKPMYPDFPKQVMSLDEATFRFHQLCHYFSTYGFEEITGMNVTKGWLPDVKETEKTKTDITLLKLKVIKLCNLQEFTKIVVSLISKTERLTIPESNIVKYAMNDNYTNDINGNPILFINGNPILFNVTFKENMSLLVNDDFLSKDNNIVLKAVDRLFLLSKHSGDVLDCIDKMILNNNFKQFRTFQKRMLVSLLEQFEINDFKSNLSLKRERNLTILRYLSYNRFSKKTEHKQKVTELRQKKLMTWNATVEYRLKYNSLDSSNIGYIGERPMMLLRMTRRLLRLGFNFNDIQNTLIFKVDQLNMQSLISLTKITNCVKEENKDKYKDDEKHNFMIYNLVCRLISEKMKTIETPLKNKKVYIDETIFDWKHSNIETNEKSCEGGYIRSGLAIKIPNEIKTLRFFTYWNDKNRIDIDLHSDYIVENEGIVEKHHVGWNGCSNIHGIVTSGDITHSDAAEYIDIDLEKVMNKNIKAINNRISSYTQVPFKSIETIFTGMIAVSNIVEDVVLYDNKNVLFRHDLNSNQTHIEKYCSIYIEDKILKINGSSDINSDYNVYKHIEQLLISQNSEIVQDKDCADIVLSLDRTIDENNISLIDENYFMDY